MKEKAKRKLFVLNKARAVILKLSLFLLMSAFGVAFFASGALATGAEVKSEALNVAGSVSGLFKSYGEEVVGLGAKAGKGIKFVNASVASYGRDTIKMVGFFGASLTGQMKNLGPDLKNGVKNIAAGSEFLGRQLDGYVGGIVSFLQGRVASYLTATPALKQPAVSGGAVTVGLPVGEARVEPKKIEINKPVAVKKPVPPSAPGGGGVARVLAENTTLDASSDTATFKDLRIIGTLDLTGAEIRGLDVKQNITNNYNTYNTTSQPPLTVYNSAETRQTESWSVLTANIGGVTYDFSVGRTLMVSGNATVGSTLTANSLAVTGNSVLSGTLTVTGNTTLSSLSSGSLALTGASSSTIAHDLAVAGILRGETVCIGADCRTGWTSGGAGVNEWGRFGTTYGVSALMASSTYPVWFDGAVYASSTLIVSGSTTLGDTSSDIFTINAVTSSTAPMSITASTTAPLLFLTNTASVSSTDPHPALRIAGSLINKNLDLFVDENGNAKIRTTSGGGGNIYFHPDGGSVYMQTNLIIGDGGNATIQASGRANFSYDPAVGAPSLWLSTSSTYPTYKTYIAVNPAETINFDRFLHFSHGNNDRLIVGYDGDMWLNASSTYSGNLFTLRKGDASRFYVDNAGNVLASGTITTGGHLYPSTDNLYDAGSSSTQWRYGNFQGGLLVADGTTTGTLTKNSLILAQDSSNNLGKFYVDASGNASVSGTLTAFGNTTLKGALSVTGLLTPTGGISTTTIDGVIIGGSTRAAGYFTNLDANGAVTLPNASIADAALSSNVPLLNANNAFTNTNSFHQINPSTDNLYDVGSSSTQWRYGNFQGGLLVANGTTTGTLTKNSLILAQDSSNNLGKFYVGSSGDISASGSLDVFTNLSVGAKSTGIAQLKITASSTIAIPLLVVADNGENILKMSSSTISMYYNGTQSVYNGGAVLTLGQTGGALGGGVDIKNSGNFVIRSYGSETILAQLGSIGYDDDFYGGLVLSKNGNATTTLDYQSIILGQAPNYNLGKFYVNSSGDVSASGTITSFGNITASGHLLPSTDNLYDIGSSSTQWRYGNFQGGVLVADGSTSGTITKNSLILAQDSSNNLGKFAVDSSGNVQTSGTIKMPNGSNTAPSYSFQSAGADDSGMFLIDANSVGIAGGAILTSRFRSGSVDLLIPTTVFSTFAVGTVALPTALTVATNGTMVISSSTLFATTTLDYQSFALGNNSFSSSANGTTTIGSLQTGNLNFEDNAGLVSWVNLNITTTTANIDNSYSASINDNTLLTIYGQSNTAGTANNLGILVGFATTTPPYTIFDIDHLFTVASTTGNTNTSGTLRVWGGASTGGLLISATNSTTTLTSYVTDGIGAGAFVLNSANAITSTTPGTNLDRVLLAVQSNGANKFVVSGGGNVYATAGFNANSTQYGIGDVAEYVNLIPNEAVEPGDVLVVSKDSFNKYKKSSLAYTKEVAGVVSDTGAFVMGASGLDRAPLALAGLVRVKVSMENGAISVGDYLVSAAKVGYAMRYDSVNPQAAGLVGMALEPATEDGKITIMVNKGLLDGAAVTNLNVTQNAAGQLVGTADLNLAGYSILNVKGIASASGFWSIDESGNFISKDIKADKAQVKQMVVEKGGDLNKNTVGEATIKLNQTSAVVANAMVSSTAKIFITFRNNPKAFWWISRQIDGEFEVSLSQSASEDITFDYWLVGVAVSSDVIPSEAEESLSPVVIPDPIENPVEPPVVEPPVVEPPPAESPPAVEPPVVEPPPVEPPPVI